MPYKNLSLSKWKPCLLGSFLCLAVGMNTAQATVISLEGDGVYTTEAKLDFRQQRKAEIEKLLSEIPLTRVPALPPLSGRAERIATVKPFILAMGQQFDNLSPEIIQAVIKIESNFDAAAVSHKGAQGLMQLMPATADRYGLTNAYDPQENIRAGSSELSRLLTVYDDLPLALAAYNAGEGAVKKYDGIPPFPETQNYVVKVLSEVLTLQTQKLSALALASISDSVSQPTN